MSRLPRFHRAAKIAPIGLTERDCENIRLIHRHRLWHLHQLVALIGGNILDFIAKKNGLRPQKKI
jgi:hypothetical protein